MKFEELGYEGVIESHIKIFMYLANKYIRTIRGFDRQDLIHEQKLACYQALSSFDDTKQIGAFLYAVAENRMKSIYRHENRQKRSPGQIMYLESSRFENAGVVIIADVEGPEERYYIEEVKVSIVAVAKETLSEYEYQLFEMTLAGNLTVPEMAQLLSKTEKQILSGISRMRRKMREKRESTDIDL